MRDITTGSRERRRIGEPGAIPAEPCVLIADDDRDMREWLAHTLSRIGCVPVTFSSGNDLLTYIASWLLDPSNLRKPDCVVVDVNMPGFSGLDVLQGLQSATDVLPFIVVTARDDRRTREIAENLGAAAFLRKPLQANEFLAVVRSAMEVSP